MSVTYTTRPVADDESGYGDLIGEAVPSDAGMMVSITVPQKPAAFVSGGVKDPRSRRSMSQALGADFCMHSVRGIGGLLGTHFSISSSDIGLAYTGIGTLVGAVIAGLPHSSGDEFSLDAAQARLRQLEAASMPSLFGFGDADGAGAARRPLSRNALARADEILRRIAVRARIRPLHRLSVFPMPDGGLQLQQTRSESTLSVEIPADLDAPILVEQVSDEEYRSNEFRNCAKAADFVAFALR